MNDEQAIYELSLLLMYLTSWREKHIVESGISARSWKGYDINALDKLKESDLIDFSPRAKSLYLTEKGLEEAQALKKKYIGFWAGREKRVR